MGGGKKGGGSATTGYSYYLDMAYAYSTRVDGFRNFYIDDEIVFPIASNINSGVITINVNGASITNNYQYNTPKSAFGTYYIGLQISVDERTIGGWSNLPSGTRINYNSTGNSAKSTTCSDFGTFIFDNINFSNNINHTVTATTPKTNLVNVNINREGSVVNLKTGKHAVLYGSNNSNSNVTIYLGGQTHPDPYLSIKTGEFIIYQDVCYMVFPQAFIGDNVRNVPSYGVLLEKTHIPSLDYLFLPTAIEGMMNYYPIKTINPVAVLLDIMINQLKIDYIDIDSFRKAAYTLQDEKLGINFVLDTQSKALDIINGILDIIEGMIYYDQISKMFVLKLIRYENVDITNIDSNSIINIDVASEISIKTKSIYDLNNSYKFEYTNISNNQVPKKDTKTLTNQALINLIGYVKTTTVDLTMLATEEALSLVMSRKYRSMSYPCFTVSFKVNAFDFLHSIGDLLWLQPDINNENYLPFRVTKISGDSADDSFYIVEGKEDISQYYQPSNIMDINFDVHKLTSDDINTPLDTAPELLSFFPCTPENASVKSIIPIFTYPKNRPANTRFYAYEIKDEKIEVYPYIYSYVTQINNFVDNTTKLIDRDVEIVVYNDREDMYEINGTESDLQRIVYAAYWGNEAIAIKNITNIASKTYKITGIIRGVQDTLYTHNVGESFWLAPANGNQIVTFPIFSYTPTINVYAENKGNRSPISTKNYDYTFSVETPYPPNSVKKIKKGGSVDLVWTPRVRLKGANYRNCDSIIGGQDEGTCETNYNIYKNGVLLTTLSPSLTSTTEVIYNVTTEGTYSVEATITSYKSPQVSIVVNADDLK